MQTTFEMENNIAIKTGTVSGTLLSIVPNLLSEDIVRTIILAALGAVVSFGVSFFLKWLTNQKNK
jgi:hypothetical protein